jgi:hypothetical protein
VTAQLLFVHGRSQQHKDAATLKGEWLASLRRGLEAQGLTLPISDDDVHFPYYGDTLEQLVGGVPEGEPLAKVIVRGGGDEEEEEVFFAAVLEEARAAKGITDDQIHEGVMSPSGDRVDVIVRGVRPTAWMHGVLQALDCYVPGASGATLAVVTHDVYQYLRNPGVRDVIDSGVLGALQENRPTVVVAHSLGSVVAYNILRREVPKPCWSVPLLVTVGCPLAVRVIARSLAPLNRPLIGDWVNAADPRDIVALWPLEAPRFPLTQAIRNKWDVDNHTDNRHGIEGYLDDIEVARWIHDAIISVK